MAEFKVGDVVRLVNREVAVHWGIESLLNKAIEVKNIDDDGCTTYNGFFIPLKCCEVVAKCESK